MPFVKGKSGNANGRPKGCKTKVRRLTDEQRIALAKNADGIMPLEFMMSVLRDPKARIADKVYAAKIAAPYLHRKMPIAIEGGDPTKPLMVLDAAQLRNLSSGELKMLQTILSKIGATLG